jgi:uncharacterized protein YndB with AHSA1/START domain
VKDMIEELRAVQRAVGEGTLPAGEATVVTLHREYPAAVEDVWDAVTSAERIARWFMPVSGDLREGGRYQLEGNAGGEIRRCEAPSRLVLTWNPGEQPDVDDSIVEVRLEPTADGTRLTLVHTAVPPEDFWDTYGPGAVGVGWDLSLVGLAAHLAGIEMGSPEEMDADPVVRTCLRESSEAWRVAAIDAGEDPVTAQRRASATSEFYAPGAD